MYHHCTGQEVTRDMLRTLHEIGSGGLIIAEDRFSPFTVTSSRDIDLRCPDQIIIYGHGDLTHDLACDHDVWDQVAGEVTDSARANLDHWTAHSTDPLVCSLREAMRTHRMDLTHRPVIDRTEEWRKLIQDTYALRSHPHITLGVSCVRMHRRSLLVSPTLFDRGRPAASWGEHTLTDGKTTADLASHVLAWAGAYLSRRSS
ncbi:hypothetical protein ACWGKS_29500 [Nocardiopsis sp. NPDC055879]